MAFDIIGAHSHYDDAESILDPQILAYAAEIALSRYEGQIWNRIGGVLIAPTTESFKIAARTRTDLNGVIGDGAGTGWDNAATTALPVPAASINILVVGSILDLQSGATHETVVVTAIDRAANTISVEARGAGNTSASAWADASTFKIIGHAIRDADATNVEARHEKTYKYENVYQLIFERVQMYTSDLNKREFFQNQLNVEYNEALDRVFRLLARNIVNGVKVTGTNSVKAMSAGIMDQLVDTAGGDRAVLRQNIAGQFTENKLKTALDTVLTKGNPNAIYLHPDRKAAFNAFTNATNLSLLTGGNTLLTARGLGNYATTYEYEGASLELVVDSAMPTDRIAIVNEAKIGKFFKPDDPLRFGPSKETQDRLENFVFQGKVGYSVRDVGTDHIDLYGITS